MDLLEDPVFKSKYQKHKLRVKLWESDFMEKYGRKPNKNDIKEADITIREAYKMYWKLKTRALDETLTDITFCEDKQANISNNSPTKLTTQKIEERKVNENDIAKDSENVDPHNKSRIAPSLIDEPRLKNLDDVWNENACKNKEPSSKKKQNLLIGRSSSFQLSQNKFTTSSLTKRNPRKSLSLTKIRNKNEKDENTSKLESSTNSTQQDKFDVNEETKITFDKTLKIVHEEPKVTCQQLNIIHQLMEGQATTVNRSLNQNWLNRCLKQSGIENVIPNSNRFSCFSDSGTESMESSINSPKEDLSELASTKPMQISDEEDFICNSDSEEEYKNKRIRNLKKTLSSEERATKRLCTSNDLNISPNESTLATISMMPNDSIPDASDIKCDITQNDIKIDKISTQNILRTRDATETIGNLSISSNNALKKLPMNEKSEIVKETEETPTYTSRTLRNVHRRIKQNISDNSDSDFIVKEIAIKKKEKETEGTKCRTRGNSKEKSISVNDAECASSKEQKPTRVRGANTKNAKNIGENENSIATKVKRRCRKKKEEAKIEDNGVSDLTATNDDIQIYGIETLDATPRIAIQSQTGNLITDFAKSMSSLNENSSEIQKTISNEHNTATSKLEQKIASNSLNDNFIRINLKKKVYVRGKKSFNFSKYKKNQWKQKKKTLGSSDGNLDVVDFMEKNGTKCFKCGNSGHFARQCPAMKLDELLPLSEIDSLAQYPTLEEAEKMATQRAAIAHVKRPDKLPERPLHVSETNIAEPCCDENEYHFEESDFAEPMQEKEVTTGHQIPNELLARLLPPKVGNIQPLYATKEDGSLIETPEEVFESLYKFGHKSFRSGQEKAIMRILSGQSTLLTLSTGSGKSLCYQLPAYLYSKYYDCITLVISPLVSLMDDQVTGMPEFLSAACLHTGQTEKVRNNVMQLVKESKVQVLLVSPEAVVAGEKSTGFGALIRQLPPIAFACIDEAHCISQWSHNFRPSYLMVCRVLKEKLKVRTILGLTATATKTTAKSIVDHLDIHDKMAGVISDIPLPSNLFLTVSRDDIKDNALVTLLLSDRFRELDSIIIYCTRREECARIAGLLRISLQDSRKPENKNSKISCIAEAYHAGLSSYRRKTVQKAFMNGQIRIVVATVAFGMGINKPNIRSVIHYNMPATFEGYVQEVGRAGRDQLPAQCHVFLGSKEDNDKWELRRHIYANGIDRHTIRRLLAKVFIPCSCAKVDKSGKRCSGHEVAIPIEETVKALDITEETICTLLCYLELHPKRYLTVLSSAYATARVSSYSGPQALKLAAQSSPPLAMAIALDLKKGISHEDSNTIEFPVIDVASVIGWDSGVVKSHLKDLEWTTVNGQRKRSTISVRYDTLALRVKAPGDLTDAELDEALEVLTERTHIQETVSLYQLETITSALHKFSVPTIKQCLSISDELKQKSEELKNTIREYFQSDGELSSADVKIQSGSLNEAQIAADVRSIVLSYRDTSFTGRAVARIFHGIQSPNYPALIWGKCRFWRAHLSYDFNAICQIATKEILALR